MRCQYLVATAEPSTPASLPRYPQETVTAAGTSAACDRAPGRVDWRSGSPARTAVGDGSTTVEPDDELMQAVMGRLGETSGFSATLRLTCPAHSHQDRATDDHAERGRYGAVAAAQRGRNVL